MSKVKGQRSKVNCQLSAVSSGFTLIELLIVIAIIGILAAVVIAVINPAQQRRKAREAVAKSNIAKICQALVACQSSLSTANASYCNTWDEIGVSQPTQPIGVTWTISGSGIGDADYASAYVTFPSTEGSCRYRCMVYNDFRNWSGESAGAVVNDSGTCVTK